MHPHRLEYASRPKEDCAADHPFLRSSQSLVYTFLILTEPLYEDEEDLDTLYGGVMTCGFCVREGKKKPHEWSEWDRKRWRGSSGNFHTHFEGAHAEEWAAMESADLQARDPKEWEATFGSQQLKIDEFTSKVHFNSRFAKLTH